MLPSCTTNRSRITSDDCFLLPPNYQLNESTGKKKLNTLCKKRRVSVSEDYVKKITPSPSFFSKVLSQFSRKC